MSPASKAQQKAVNNAAQRGESVNAYINRAIDKAMSEDDSST